MIDENGLEEVKQTIEMRQPLQGCLLDEIIRLARLGLWAEKHAIPLIQWVEPHGDWYVGFPYEANKALAALPKETK